MSNQNYMIGTRELTSGDKVRDSKRTKTQDIPLLVVEKNNIGKTKGQRDMSKENELPEDRRYSHIEIGRASCRERVSYSV